jgi:predicted DNA-binding protein
MKEQPTYKSVKVLRETWQRLTQLSALTGEPRTKLIDRLVSEALERQEKVNVGLKS